MENGYSLNETVQSQIGEFQYLYVNGQDIGSTVLTLDTRVTALEGGVSFDGTALAADIELLKNRVTALEGSSSDSSIVDNLITQLQALQTRTGTLESLITLLPDKTSNDTQLEHRLSSVEQKLTAIKALYDAKRAVYNMPLNW